MLPMNEEFNVYKDKICIRIRSLLEEKEFLLVAIDGCCGAGKTTLAETLSHELSAGLVHIDDFYLPFEKRTSEIMCCPGGNIDYSRLTEEVLKPLSSNKVFIYKSFDCKTNSYKDSKLVKPTKITIVEGAYSCHPQLIQYYDLKIFLSVTPQEQIDRIVKRNGSVKAEEFINQWIKREEDYFAAYDIRRKCDLIF